MKNHFLTLLSRTFLVTGMLTTAACSAITEDSTMTVSNKDKAVAVISSIETGAREPIGYINPDKYIQHNLAVADGLAGFGAVLQALPENSAKARVKRAFQDGDYAFTHTEYNFFGPKVGFDLFRFEEGKIVEHWDNLQALMPANPSGRTQLDGSTEIRDLEKTEQNKAIVADFVNTILIKGDMTQVAKFIDPKAEDYLQHNPAIADGLSGLGTALTALAEQGMPLVFEKNHLILGEGNFVLSISEGRFMNQHVAFYDLFRLTNGKIVEHWDTIETIPAKDQWKNSNGKFGF